MPLGKLSALQERLLVVLAGLDPPWTLSGGAALAGFHTAHRGTRDLDLFCQQRRDLGDVVSTVRSRSPLRLSLALRARGRARQPSTSGRRAL